MGALNLMASRVGAIAIHYDPKFNRWRGFFESLITTEAQLDDFLRLIVGLNHEKGASRVVIRTLVQGEMIESFFGEVKASEFCVEAGKKLVMGDETFYLLYVAWNRDDRRTTPLVRRYEENLIQNILNRPKNTIYDQLQDAADKGFYVQRLRQLDAEDRFRVFTAFEGSLPDSAFSLRTHLDSMIIDLATFHVLVLRHRSDDKIYSVSISERAEVPFADFGTLALSEISCCVKIADNPDIPAGGWSAPLNIFHSLLAAKNDVDLQFAECRSALGAINCLMHYTGFDFCGVLEKHIVTGGQEDIFESQLDPVLYRNLNLWAIDQKGLGDVAKQARKFLAENPTFFRD